MRTLRNVIAGLCSTALVLTPVTAPLARAVAGEPWEIVPEDSLRDLRGGMDLGGLVASFAIQRVVEIDGVVVARMQMVISNLDRLANGGMPTITVTGPIAEIVQFMKTAGNVSFAGPNAGVASSAASLPAAAGSQAVPSTPVAPSAAASTPTIASSGNSGSVSAATTQSGSTAQLGNAITNAVTTAINATSQPTPSTAAASPSTAGSTANTASSLANTSGSTANIASSPANTSSSNANTASSTANAARSTTNTASSLPNAGAAASNTHLQANATPAVSAQPASTSTVSGANSSKIIPVGTSGQVVVLSNMPNAAALTTAVQNEVHAATIQTQTTISATLNSMPSLNAISLGNSIRAQVSGGGG
jgi:hypothetical protein